MPFISRRPTLKLNEEEATWLRQLSQSRSESAGRVQRAEILLRYHGGQTVSGIAARLRTNRPRVERCLAKALELGVRGALQDLPGRGRRRTLSAEARAWVVALACQKPNELGYAQELWTTRLLAQHIRRHCKAAGHSSLQHLARGTVSKILRAQAVQPHKIEYYLERRDAEFEVKMKQVLHVYRQVELWHQAGAPAELTAVLSYDEKPGIQALANTAPDLAPVPGQHARVGRDHEYVRHGTLSCWRVSICGAERCWAWCATVTAVRSSSNFCAWRMPSTPTRPAFAWSSTITPRTFPGRPGPFWPRYRTASNSSSRRLMVLG